MSGRVALLTGCSPNIVGGIAEVVAEEGASVVCVDMNPEFSEGCAAALRADGFEALGIQCDVTNEDQVVSTVGRAIEEYGTVDILVNGAARQIRRGLLEASLDDFRAVSDVILLGAFLFTREVARGLISSGTAGSVINLLSTEAHQGNIDNIAYGTAKAGLMNFTRASAMDLARFQIRVNSVTPTATDPSEGVARAQRWGLRWQGPLGGGPEARPDVSRGDAGIPLGRRPPPRSYGRAVVYLASDDGEFVTGTDLRVDGGAIGRYWRWNPQEEAVGR